MNRHLFTSDYTEDSSYTTKTLINGINRINRILKHYPEEQELACYDYKDLCQILYELERMAIKTRQGMADFSLCEYLLLEPKHKQNIRDYSLDLIEQKEYIQKLEEKNDYLLDSYPVDFNFKDGLITVHTPLTFKRGYKHNNFGHNYYLAKCLNSKIELWGIKNEKKSLWFLMEEPTVLIMKRVLKKYNINKICDADNIENQRILNTICSAFGISDNAKNMKYFSFFEEDEKEENQGTFFYIFAEKDAEKYKHLFKGKYSKC